MTKSNKFVFVSQRIDYLADRMESRDSLDQRLVNWLFVNGYTAIPISNFVDSNDKVYTILEGLAELLSPVGIVLSGGNDVGLSPARDCTEASLLNIANYRNIPVLGICRGFQFINYWLGGSNRDIENHVAKQHKLHTLTETYGKWPKIVNSFHSKTINVLAEELIPASAAPDNCIESAVATSLNWEGWMWHPERFEKHDEVCNLRVKNLFG